jgi:hypothetical protein
MQHCFWKWRFPGNISIAPRNGVYVFSLLQEDIEALEL